MRVITFGPGRQIERWFSVGQVHVLKGFEPGPGGDRLINWDFFFNWFPGSPNRWWFEAAVLADPAAAAGNPFDSGQLRLIDSAEGALFQYRATLMAPWETMVIFEGVLAASLTEENLGWSPSGGRPAGGTVTYGDGRDDVFDTNGDDVVYLGGGDDQIGIGHGNDLIYLGPGNDTTFLNGPLTGLKQIYGGEGNDRVGIQGRAVAPGERSARAELYGEGGDDELVGGYNGDFIDGGAGSDYIYGIWHEDLGLDAFFGTYIGGDGADSVGGGAGFTPCRVEGATIAFSGATRPAVRRLIRRSTPSPMRMRQRASSSICGRQWKSPSSSDLGAMP